MPFPIQSHIGSLEANRTLKDLFLARAKEPHARRRISVTDLLNLKQSYWKRKHPEIVPSLERQEKMWSGTGFHEDFQRRVTSEEFTEQSVDYEGIVGKIDIFEDYPVELKTTGGTVEAPDLVRKRPSYIEQLAMYCAMAGKPRGQIIIYSRDAPPQARLDMRVPPPLKVFDLHFMDLDAIRGEMVRRATLLKEALEKDDPARLPACPWAGRQCDYMDVCDCARTPQKWSYTLVDQVAGVLENPEATRAILSKLAAVPERPLGLNDLVFPRKTYYERTRGKPAGGEEEEDWRASDRMSSMESQGLKSALQEILYRGAWGEVSRLPVALGPLRGRVTLFRDVPTLFRVTRFPEIVERHRLVPQWPFYFTRLAIECALTQRPRGRLVLYYEKMQKDESKFMVYDVPIRDPEGLRAEAQRRLDILQKALRGEAPPGELEPCPAWMQKKCAYGAECGCGAPGE